MRSRFVVASAVALAAVGPLGAQPRWRQVPFPHAVRCVALASDTSGWAAATVGPNLTGLLRYDGHDWTLADTFRNQLIYDIALAGDSAWAVGEQFNFPDGVVLRWDGGSWTQETDPFDRALQAVSFAGPGAGFAGGASPQRRTPVMRRDATGWSIDTTLSTGRIILGMAATHPGKCYAVGDSGSIFRWDDGEWTRLRTLAPAVLRRVAMESNTEGWAVGDGGLILRCFKDTWAIARSPTKRRLSGLAVAGTSGEAWAVGDSGTILHWTGDSWLVDPFAPEPADAPLYTVAFSSGSEGWAFGFAFAGAAVALHYTDDTTGVTEARAPAAAAGPSCRPSVLAPGGRVSIRAGAGGPVEVRDRAGRLVRAIGRGPLAADWDGRDDSGAAVPAGCYFVRCGPAATAVVKPR
jgi:photosystem II stability/assembly factor-like uncharacterized protein